MLGRFPHHNITQIETIEDSKVAGKAIQITGIENIKKRIMTNLSGGERQLVSIAAALSQSKDVILLDEPVSHLDINHSVKIMDILYDLNKSGSTIVTVLHDINIAANYCNRVIAIKDGRIFFDGHPNAVITYKAIEELFAAPCIVLESPITKRPYTFPLPGYVKGVSQ